jgi:hypothetical protein
MLCVFVAGHVLIASFLSGHLTEWFSARITKILILLYTHRLCGTNWLHYSSDSHTLTRIIERAFSLPILFLVTYNGTGIIATIRRNNFQLLTLNCWIVPNCLLLERWIIFRLALIITYLKGIPIKVVFHMLQFLITRRPRQCTIQLIINHVHDRSAPLFLHISSLVWRRLFAYLMQ